jgi:glycosyltransferase involved in cell wall biosynthesis
MRVLWFTNIELPAVRRRLTEAVVDGGGWMESLRVALCARGGTRLAVAATGRIPFDAFEDEGVRYYHLDAPPDLSGIGGVLAHWRHRTEEGPVLRQAVATVDSFVPDLVHVHGSERPFGLLAGGTSPVLLSMQGLLAACSRVYLKDIPPIDIARDVTSGEFLKGRGLVHDAWRMRVAARREHRILQRCHFLSGRTDWDREVIRAVNPRARYYHVDEILRPEFYGRMWRPDTARPFVIHATGGTDPYKGLITLLEAVAVLRHSARPDVRLRVAGGLQSAEVWPIAMRTVERLKLGGTVEWLGSLNAAQIVSELTSASVYVHPSYADNSPNALAEAMILGMPCVASAVGGIPSLLRDGRDGVLCASGDVTGLAASLAVLAADPARAARLGRDARRLALARHDPDTVVEAMLATYCDVVARHQAGER